MATTTAEERSRNEDRNIRAVHDFKNYWAERGYDLRSSGVGLKFQAQVSYSSSKKSAIEQTEVRVSFTGYGTDGAVDIDEAGALTTEDYHLGMLAQFGKYTVDSSSGDLLIENNSPKMNGKYEVRITPLVGTIS